MISNTKMKDERYHERYYKIKKYCDIIPEFALYFTFAKKNPIFRFIYPENIDDLLQIIALIILENNTLKLRNNALGREMRKFVGHVIGVRKKIKKTKKKYKINPSPVVCDLCGREKKEYLRGSLIPGVKMCNACYSTTKSKIKKNVLYKFPTDLVATAIKNFHNVYIPNSIKTEEGICCITGMKCQTVKRINILPIFSDNKILKAPDSDRIGVCAAISIRYNPGRFNFLVTEKGLSKCNKKVFIDLLLNGVQNVKNWSIYINESYSQYDMLHMKVNTKANGNDRKYGIWRFNGMDVDASGKKRNNTFYKKLLSAHIDYGIDIDFLKNLNGPDKYVKKILNRVWKNHANWGRKNYKDPLYQLCCYLLS